MTDTPTEALARAAGVAVRWKDVFGRSHDVSRDTLRAVLAALDMPAGSDSQAAESLERLRAPAAAPPPLVTGEIGEAVIVPFQARAYHYTLEDGRVFEGRTTLDTGRCVLPAILEPGYHQVSLDDKSLTVAVAPPRCYTVRDAEPDRDLWGLAVQLYALRRDGDGGIGDFAGLAEFARAAARHGASALAISPVHAQFTADPARFSPYAPSSRTMLNVLHAPLDAAPNSIARDRLAGFEALELVDWPGAARARLAVLREWFAAAEQDPDAVAALAAFRREGGDALESHVTFEALQAEFLNDAEPRWNWRDWPAEFQDPAGPAVKAFAQRHAEAIRFHAFLQYQADAGLGAAQRAARAAGMPIGLISDLAVGTSAGGSHCWSRQSEMLLGLSIGAPPDLLSRDGQDWGLAAFSPYGLAQHGFRAFIELLQAALRHAGGVRIDHGMGLNRLWVVPEGAKSSEGAYLAFPETDMLRLVRLESQRHKAIVLAEDLGTVPEGFQQRLQSAGVFGMRVLAFERTEDSFSPPAGWEPQAAAMTSTHDLPPVAGWWAGRDLDWREQLGLFGEDGIAPERAAREADRARLWAAFRQSGAATGEPPAVADHEAVADAAVLHTGLSASRLFMLPLEDALGLVEQPNLPGTTDEHPNWRRRFAGPADQLLEVPAVAARLAKLDQARRAPGP